MGQPNMVAFPQVNLPPIVGGPRIDFSSLANLPNAFWQGQEVGRENKLRGTVSDILKNGGSWEDVRKAITAVDPLAGAKLQEQYDTGAKNRYGMQIYFDQNGNPYQPMSGGGMAPVNLPAGTKITQPVTYLQTPQGVYRAPKNAIQGGDEGLGAPQYQPNPNANLQPGEVPISPVPTQNLDQNGNPVSDGSQPPQAGPQPFIAKDYQTPELQKTTGEVMAKARAALPAAEAMVRRSTGLIANILKDPNLDNAVGPIQSRLPTLRGGTADVEAKIKQLTGNVFTSAYESLRGAQAITDVEGVKATAAIARVEDMKQSDPGYRQALIDAAYEVFELGNIVRKKAGVPTQPNPFPAPEGSSEGGGVIEWKDF